MLEIFNESRAMLKASDHRANAPVELSPDNLASESAGQSPRGWAPFRFNLSDVIFLVGILLVVLPTMVFVARETWSSEQGAHAPIVLMTGLWLIWNKWPDVRTLVRRPSTLAVWPLLAFLLFCFFAARVTQIVEVEGFVMYALVIASFFAVVGGSVIKKLTFPIVYIAFMFPPPETLIYALTLPIKVAISESSVWLLSLFGYPIGGSGVTIQIGQYQLLVAAACSGLNSIVSLSALTIFYIYVRHSNDVRLAALLLMAVAPVAVLANFIRVLILILLTYHAGEAVGQGFLHELAGVTMFATALGLIAAFEFVLQRFFALRQSNGEGQPA